MGETDIVQEMIERPGQGQADRVPPELEPDFPLVDERRPEDLLVFARRLAESVRFFGTGAARSSGDWRAFFPLDVADPARAREQALALLQDHTGTTPPHLALLLAFLLVHEEARAAMNRLTERHLDFFFGRALGFEPRGARPDRAHVLVELKRGSPPAVLGGDTVFSAGKGAGEVELLYAPVRETLVSTAKVAALHSIYVDPADRGTVRCAIVANSSDGVGGPLAANDPSWSAFGHVDLPAARIGFAFASRALRLAEGERVVRLVLELGGPAKDGLDAEALAGALDVYLTGPKGWIGPFKPTAHGSDGSLLLTARVAADDPAIVDYDPKLHGTLEPLGCPMMQLLFATVPGRIGYEDVRDLTITSARLHVSVRGITSLTLESDAGALNPKKAFLPFGPQPVAGSRFWVGCEEAFSKRLAALSLKLRWLGPSPDFSALYADYGEDALRRGDFTVSCVFSAIDGWSARGVPLFEPGDPGDRVLSFPRGASPSPALPVTLRAVGAFPAEPAGGATRRAPPRREDVGTRFRQRQALAIARWLAAPEARTGFLTLALERDFGHALYRKLTLTRALARDPTALNEPYTPTLQGITLDYEAESAPLTFDASVADTGGLDELRFYHVDCLGLVAERLRSGERLESATDRSVPLLPAHADEGELLIGLSGISPGGGVTLLVQVADDSADVTLDRSPVTWSVLCANRWKALDEPARPLDTTNQLLASGVVQLVVPAEATTGDTLVPGGHVWLRAAVRKNVDAVCRLLTIAANAVEVECRNRGEDPAHQAPALEPGRIVRMKSGPASVKAVTQPYASFAGRAVERRAELVRRASERLRHRGRAITPWDYERLVLDAFCNVRLVKCIPHAKPGMWLAPGNVTLVVVPEQRNPPARVALQPRADTSTLRAIEAYVAARRGSQWNVFARNPSYQGIRLDFLVRFRAGYAFSFYRSELERALIRHLSPWAFDADQAIAFGGRVYRAALLAFVEELPYVDFVEAFRMTTTGPEAEKDVAEVKAAAPDVILVSARSHRIGEVPLP